jgi:hypothetical protein
VRSVFSCRMRVMADLNCLTAVRKHSSCNTPPSILECSSTRYTTTLSQVSSLVQPKQTLTLESAYNVPHSTVPACGSVARTSRALSFVRHASSSIVMTHATHPAKTICQGGRTSSSTLNHRVPVKSRASSARTRGASSADSWGCLLW